jgi:hypothetical protein
MKTVADRAHRGIQLVLRGGLLLSVALMLAGGIATCGSPRADAHDVKLFDLLERHDASTTLLAWGVFVLALTPLVRAIALITVWCHARDWRFVAVATSVVLTLVAAAVVGKG